MNEEREFLKDIVKNKEKISEGFYFIEDKKVLNLIEIMKIIEEKKEDYYLKFNDFPNYVIIPDIIIVLIFELYEKYLITYPDSFYLLGMKVIGTPTRNKIEEIEVI